MTLRHFVALTVVAHLALLAPMTGAAQGALPDLALEEGVSGWRLGGFNVVDVDQRNVPASEREVEYTGVMEWTANPDAPGLLLTCNEKSNLSATFSVAAVDFGDPAVTSAKSRVRVLKGRLIVDGERPASKQQFMVRRKINVIHAMDKQAAYTVVSAIYTNKPVRLEVDGQDGVDYDFPPVDDELREFVANCPAFKQDGE
jgi:hypothetical protein